MLLSRSLRILRSTLSSNTLPNQVTPLQPLLQAIPPTEFGQRGRIASTAAAAARAPANEDRSVARRVDRCPPDSFSIAQSPDKYSSHYQLQEGHLAGRCLSMPGSFTCLSDARDSNSFFISLVLVSAKSEIAGCVALKAAGSASGRHRLAALCATCAGSNPRIHGKRRVSPLAPICPRFLTDLVFRNRRRERSSTIAA